MTRNALALTLGFLSLAAILTRAHLPEPGAATVLLAVLAVGLEFDAVAVLPRGLFTTGFAPALALALLQGPASGAATLLLGTGLRVPLASRHENLAALAPSLAALALLSWVDLAAPAVALWVVLSLHWPASPNRPLEGLRLAVVALLGPALAFLAPVSPWACLLLAPVLLGCHRMVRIYLRRLESTMVGRAQLQARERKTREALSKTGQALERTAAALEGEALQRGLLQELTAELSARENLKSVLDTILEALTQLVPCRQASIYLRGQSGPALVERCLESAAVQTDGEQVALPMQGEAALLVEGKFGPLERQLLLVLAGAGGLAIQSASRYQQGQEAVELHRRAHARLKVWVERLSFLLDSARKLTAGLEPTEILLRLRDLLRVTLPHHHGAILGHLSWPEPFQAPPHLASVTQTGQAGGWVAAPVLSERGVQAVVALATEAPYSQEQLDILSLLCHQAGVALHNAALHQEAINAQSQLVQSSKLAAVGQLAAGVAHELNTPLCAALVAVEMGRLDLEQGEVEALRAKLETAETAGARCQEIIEKLLYYARDAVETETEAELNQIVTDTLELLGRQVRPEGLRLDTVLAPDLPLIRVDCHELQQVVSNLLLNARDAVMSQPERREILLTTRQDGSWVELTVADRGPGISPALQAKIFEPFFTTKPAGQGTGLGLSVSRDIVARHGGELTVASVPGEGASFRLRLPVHP